jgi:non-specific serine/threonine protein kinase
MRWLGLAPLAGALLGCSSSHSSPPLPAPLASAPGTWTERHPVPVARFETYAVSDGSRVYLLGGITGTFGDISTAQPSRRVDVYDPATNLWSAGPDLPADAPKHHLTVAFYQGRIYVLGGFDGILNQLPNEPFRPVATAYVLDSGVWRRIADAPLARGAATAQAIGSKIYVTGGAPTEHVMAYDELDIYDPATDKWARGARMPMAREHLASCAIGGKFLVMGGWFGTQSTVTTAAEEYDPATDSWTRLPDLPTARGGLEAIDLDGTCRVIGGEDWALAPPGTFATQEGFDPQARTWQTYAPMRVARHGFGLAQQNGKLFALGGGTSQGNSYSDDAEMYLP